MISTWPKRIDSGDAGRQSKMVEVRAFRTSALFWISRYGPDGKLDPMNDLDRQLNAVADREQRDPLGLEDLVRQTYHQQCAR